MRVTLRSLRIGWSAILDVPDKCLVGELRAEAAKAAGIEPAGRAKLVLRGAPLQDDAQIAPLKPGDTVLVSALHSAPSGDRTGAAVDVTLPARINRSGLSPRQMRALRFLQFTCGVPEPVIHAAMRTKKRTLATLAAWCVAWYWAIRVEFGAVFVIVSAMVAIFTVGLGTRKEGEASAYSIFNGFNELPGAFNAAQLDDQMRNRGEQGPYVD